MAAAVRLPALYDSPGLPGSGSRGRETKSLRALRPAGRPATQACDTRPAESRRKRAAVAAESYPARAPGTGNPPSIAAGRATQSRRTGTRPAETRRERDDVDCRRTFRLRETAERPLGPRRPEPCREPRHPPLQSGSATLDLAKKMRVPGTETAPSILPRPPPAERPLRRRRERTAPGDGAKSGGGGVWPPQQADASVPGGQICLSSG